MAELRRWGAWAVAAVALLVIVVGLLPGPAEPTSDAARAEAIAQNLRCPFCNGESIADAPSQIARDLEDFVVEKVGEGWGDEQIYTYFETRYGERVRLDPPLAGWAVVLWLTPVAIAAVGGVAIVSQRRSRTRGTAAARPVVPEPET